MYSSTRIALLGFGTVGRAVARILCTHPSPSLRLTHICARNIAQKKVSWVPADVHWTERIEEVLEANVDVVIELIGGLSPAHDWVRRALGAGKSVVTANKQLIARHGQELSALARSHGAHLQFEASVAGGIPVIRAVQDGLAGDRLVGIRAILNGTCNYILTRMEADRLALPEALAQARALGLAEADPTDDLDGLDAQAKLAILATIAFKTPVPLARIACRSIRGIDPVDFTYAHRLDSTIRQVASADRAVAGGLAEASVGPALVPVSSLLARVDGSRNLVIVRGEFGGDVSFEGEGAGGRPTAVAVISDLLSIANTNGSAPGRALFPESGTEGSSGGSVDGSSGPIQPRSAPHYLRLTVADRPGIIAAVASVLCRHDINIDAVLQEPGFPKSRLPFAVKLEACPAAAAEAALGEIAALDFHEESPLLLPILGGSKDPPLHGMGEGGRV